MAWVGQYDGSEKERDPLSWSYFPRFRNEIGCYLPRSAKSIFEYNGSVFRLQRRFRKMRNWFGY
jgi:hypothetical protein